MRIPLNIIKKFKQLFLLLVYLIQLIQVKLYHVLESKIIMAEQDAAKQALS
jgi:hypothetical protein